MPSGDDVTGEGPRPPAEPMGVLVLEHFHVQREDFEAHANTFSIIFAHEPTRRHLFSAQDKLAAYKWDVALRKASIVGLRDTLINLQAKIRNKLEVDPLRQGGASLQGNASFSPHTTTSKLLTSSNNQIHQLASQVDQETSPQAKPRT